MKLFEIDHRTSDLVGYLVNLQEETVKSTHKFLSDDEIQQIKNIFKNLSLVKEMIDM